MLQLKLMDEKRYAYEAGREEERAENQALLLKMQDKINKLTMIIKAAGADPNIDEEDKS